MNKQEKCKSIRRLWGELRDISFNFKSRCLKSTSYDIKLNCNILLTAFPPKFRPTRRLMMQPRAVGLPLKISAPGIAG